MAVNIITQEDLDQFKTQFFNDQKQILEKFKEEITGSVKPTEPVGIKWLKSHQVQRMLGISPGTLQTLRINGTIPFSKVGGSIYYSSEDVQKVLEKNKRNVY
jgi:hypothetical protein